MPRKKLHKKKICVSAFSVSEQAQKKKLVELAIGRILRMGSRPTRPGDIEEYERCRRIILDNIPPAKYAYTCNYARDYRKGAQGD